MQEKADRESRMEELEELEEMAAIKREIDELEGVTLAVSSWWIQAAAQVRCFTSNLAFVGAPSLWLQEGGCQEGRRATAVLGCSGTEIFIGRSQVG